MKKFFSRLVTLTAVSVLAGNAAMAGEVVDPSLPIVSYALGSGSGEVVPDVANNGPAVDLGLSDLGSTSWGTCGLTFETAPASVSSGGSVAKLHDACVASNALSIEVWVCPENTTQVGPARIISFSTSTSVRNFTLGQVGTQYEVRLQTSNTVNGLPALITPPGTATTDFQHIVYTRAADGVASIYVDGTEVVSGIIDGDLDWNPDFPLLLGNELTLNRFWRGTLFRASVYARALNETEVATLFSDGPECDKEGVLVPDVVGDAQAVAEDAIEALGLTVNVEQMPSATVPAGEVISQTPVAGTEVAPGSTVTIVISTGPTPVIVPDVVGDAQAVAENAIEALGLTVNVEQMPSATVPAGEVISQTPTAGTEVSPGSTVTIVVSTGPAPVTVPDVVGEDQDDASAAIAGVGLTVVVEQMPSETVPAGEVISQTPAAGTEVSPGSTVTIVVSTGPAPVIVPDVVGDEEADATDTLEEAGVTVSITREPSDTVPAGEVISQTPAAGTEVAPGTTVTIVVSTGPAPVTVPNVVGDEEADASDTLEEAGVTVSVTREPSDTVPEGEVISQTPAAGTEVVPGTTVTIVVSSGPASSAVPDVVGQVLQAAEQTLQDAGFVVGAVDPVYSDTVPAGQVVSQNPIGGTQAARGTEVDVEVSLGPGFGGCAGDGGCRGIGGGDFFVFGLFGVLLAWWQEVAFFFRQLFGLGRLKEEE
jgi:beta-lactam-binding protein with PASTA domain